MKTNLMHYLSSVYFVNQPPDVSGMLVAHHQELYCVYIYIYIYIWKLVRVVLFSWLSVGQVGFHFSPANSQLKSTTRTNCFYTYSIPPDDGLQTCPKHEEVHWWNKLSINSASSWFSLHRCIGMHVQQNIKLSKWSKIILIFYKILMHLLVYQPTCLHLSKSFNLVPANKSCTNSFRT